jgi:hypothetical protein
VFGLRSKDGRDRRQQEQRAKLLAHQLLAHPYWTGIGVLVTVVALLVPVLRNRGPSPVPDQVGAIERAEVETRHGSLQNAQSAELHGDGTRSWVFEFGEGRWSRLAIYDIERGRLRKRLVLTSRAQALSAPREVSFNGIPYRRLSPARRRLARSSWVKLHTPIVSFDKPSALQIADGSRMLLVPTIAITATGTRPADSWRATVVPVFWSADRGEYVVGRLLPDLRRWTGTLSDLRLELRPGEGFRVLRGVANQVTIDKRAHVVFAIVGLDIVQVHAFRFPTGPDDLEECPVLWRGPAPLAPRKYLPRLEHELSRGC